MISIPQICYNAIERVVKVQSVLTANYSVNSKAYESMSRKAIGSKTYENKL